MAAIMSYNHMLETFDPVYCTLCILSKETMEKRDVR